MDKKLGDTERAFLMDSLKKSRICGLFGDDSLEAVLDIPSGLDSLIFCRGRATWMFDLARSSKIKQRDPRLPVNICSCENPHLAIT